LINLQKSSSHEPLAGMHLMFGQGVSSLLKKVSGVTNDYFLKGDKFLYTCRL